MTCSDSEHTYLRSKYKPKGLSLAPYAWIGIRLHLPAGVSGRPATRDPTRASVLGRSLNFPATYTARASICINSMSPLLFTFQRCARSYISAVRQQRWYSSTVDPANLPLAGIRILDLTRVLAGVCRVPVPTDLLSNFFVLAAILYTDPR